MRIKILLIVAVTLLPHSASALGFEEWKLCIKVIGATCPLDPPTDGWHTLDHEVVLALGVTTYGTGMTPESTTIKRSGSYNGTLVRVEAGTNATIYNMRFDGNRAADTIPCRPANAAIFEVEVHGYAHIENVVFQNSRGASLVLRYGSLVNSSVSGSRSTGVFLYRGAVLGSSFIENGTAGLALWESGEKSVYANYFYRNRYEMSDFGGGGQIYLQYDSSNSRIYNNTIDGANWITTGGNINGCPTPVGQRVWGIEAEPGSSSRLLGNEIIGHTGAGIYAGRVNSLQVSGYNLIDCPTFPYCGARYIHDNYNSFAQSGGIEIIGLGAPSTNVELLGVLSRYNSGVAAHVEQGTQGVGWVGGHCLQVGYNTSSSFTNQTPASVTTCP